MERTATRSESLLRPREIQVRIRAGQTPETVAAAAQTSVERVMVFATPVLAERAFVAQQAAKASVRRRGGDGPVGLLGDAAARRLESLGLDPDTAAWDAWRREDGRWTIVVGWTEGGEQEQAEFTYDAMGRYVVAEDDPARWLVGERRAAEPAQAPEPTDRPGLQTLQTVPDETAQLALGDDALEVVLGRPLTAVRPVDAVQTETRPATPVTPAVPAAPAPAAAVPPGPMVTDPGRVDAEPTEDLTETVRAVRAVVDPRPDVRADVATEGAGAGSGGEELFEDAAHRTPVERPAERRASRPAGSGRARRSMPSWDDIMLGSAPRGD